MSSTQPFILGQFECHCHQLKWYMTADGKRMSLELILRTEDGDCCLDSVSINTRTMNVAEAGYQRAFSDAFIRTANALSSLNQATSFNALELAKFSEDSELRKLLPGGLESSIVTNPRMPEDMVKEQRAESIAALKTPKGKDFFTVVMETRFEKHLMFWPKMVPQSQMPHLVQLLYRYETNEKASKSDLEDLLLLAGFTAISMTAVIEWADDVAKAYAAAHGDQTAIDCILRDPNRMINWYRPFLTDLTKEPL